MQKKAQTTSAFSLLLVTRFCASLNSELTHFVFLLLAVYLQKLFILPITFFASLNSSSALLTIPTWAGSVCMFLPGSCPCLQLLCTSFCLNSVRSHPCLYVLAFCHACLTVCKVAWTVPVLWQGCPWVLARFSQSLGPPRQFPMGPCQAGSWRGYHALFEVQDCNTIDPAHSSQDLKLTNLVVTTVKTVLDLYIV